MEDLEVDDQESSPSFQPVEAMSWRALTLYPTNKLSFEPPRLPVTKAAGGRLPPAVVRSNKQNSSTAPPAPPGAGIPTVGASLLLVGVDPSAVPMSALLGAYARKRKKQKVHKPKDTKEVVGKKGQPAQQPQGEDQEGVAASASCAVTRRAGVKFDTAPCEALKPEEIEKRKKEKKEEMKAFRDDLEKKKQQLAPDMHDRVILDLYLQGRTEAKQMQLVEVLIEELTDRQEHVRTQAEKVKYVLNKKSIFTRTANDVRAATQANVSLRRQHTVRSLIRDSYIRESTSKDPHVAMFRTRRKLAEIMFSKTAIVRMLKAGEVDIFRPGVGEAGGLQQPRVTESQQQLHDGEDEDLEQQSLDSQHGRKTRVQSYLSAGDNGRLIKLPTIKRRYGRNVTEEWLQGPVDLGCLGRGEDAERRAALRRKRRGTLTRRPQPQHLLKADGEEQGQEEEEEEEEAGRQKEEAQEEKEEELNRGTTAETEEMEDKWVRSVKGKRIRRDNRRLLRMMRTSNRHLNTKWARFRAAEQSKNTGSVPAIVSITATVASDSTKLKEALTARVDAGCRIRQRTQKARIQERIAEVFNVLSVPAGPLLDFDLQLRESQLHNERVEELESVVELWENICDACYFFMFFRRWISLLRTDDGLIEAAATDPAVLLPDRVLEFMVSKGIFSSQGDEAPVKWLECLLTKLHDFFKANQASLSQACRRKWDNSTNHYINHVLPYKLDSPDQ